jgi:hypothetical protein
VSNKDTRETTAEEGGSEWWLVATSVIDLPLTDSLSARRKAMNCEAEEEERKVWRWVSLVMCLIAAEGKTWEDMSSRGGGKAGGGLSSDGGGLVGRF